MQFRVWAAVITAALMTSIMPVAYAQAAPVAPVAQAQAVSALPVAATAPSGIHVVTHPRDPAVCNGDGSGFKWVATWRNAKGNKKPRIMSIRIFLKGKRTFCVVVAREGKATGAKGPTLAAFDNGRRLKTSKGYFTHYALVRHRGTPCGHAVGMVRYGDRQASRTKSNWVCGR